MTHEKKAAAAQVLIEAEQSTAAIAVTQLPSRHLGRMLHAHKLQEAPEQVSGGGMLAAPDAVLLPPSQRAQAGSEPCWVTAAVQGHIHAVQAVERQVGGIATAQQHQRYCCCS